MFAPLKKVKFPVHELALMMSIALRFIPTLMQETDKIMKAQTARGVEFSSGPMKETIKSDYSFAYSTIYFSHLNEQRSWQWQWRQEDIVVVKVEQSIVY